MPYSYENLKNHVSSAHPYIFDAFVEGWNKLNPLVQASWLQDGLVRTKDAAERKSWLAWTTVAIDAVFKKKDDTSFDQPLSMYQKQLAILFHNSMDHVGQLFDLPHMPPLADREYRSPTGSQSAGSERHIIARNAANFVVHMALRKLLRKWKNNLNERGLEALREVYLADCSGENVHEDKFNFQVFGTDLGCDSESNISDEED